MQLVVTSPAFKESDWIPKRYSARGEDYSPELRIEGIDKNGVSMVIEMNDVSHPLFSNYNHWIMWNVPITSVLPEHIPKGEKITTPIVAEQGVAYGKHCYKGPKPPLKTIHNYTFIVYILDCNLDLMKNSKREEVYEAMKGHVLQEATLTGKFQSHRKEQ